jgi:hypothetical protein
MIFIILYDVTDIYFLTGAHLWTGSLTVVAFRLDQ